MKAYQFNKRIQNTMVEIRPASLIVARLVRILQHLRPKELDYT